LKGLEESWKKVRTWYYSRLSQTRDEQAWIRLVL
jgi:hypothetical protein